MQIFKEPFPKLNTKVASVALGTFDGLHKGHISVIGAAAETAKKLDGALAVWCFSSPPKNVFSPGSASPLMTPDEKATAIAALGVDILIMPDPDKALLSMSADDFIRNFVSSLSPAAVFCGFNFTFGKNALGTPDVLTKHLSALGISVNIMPPVLTDDGIPVSSSLLRKRLKEKASL